MHTRLVTEKHLLVVTETVQVSCPRGDLSAGASGRNNSATAAELRLLGQQVGANAVMQR